MASATAFFLGGAIYLNPYLRFYANAFSENASHSDPAVDSAAIIADLESVAADSLHEVKIFGTPYLTEDDISDRESRTINRYDSA